MACESFGETAICGDRVLLSGLTALMIPGQDKRWEGTRRFHLRGQVNYDMNGAGCPLAARNFQLVETPVA
jgi:hypothetical protein